VFVKGGSFVPMTTKVTNEANYSLNEFELHYYVDSQVSKSEYRLYNDDGKTTDAYQKGQYELFNFSALNTTKSLTIDFEKVTTDKAFQTVENEINLIIHNLTRVPKSFILGGKELKRADWKWDNATGLLSIKVKSSLEKGMLEIDK